MAFTRIDDDMDIIQKLDDEPNDVGGLTAAELKEEFDTAGNIMKQRVNRLMTELEAAPSAHSIGFNSTEAIAKNNVQDAIEAVQTNLETAQTELSDSINNALMGQIPDRSLEARKLVAKTITGNEIADGTLTAAKFAEETTVAGWEELTASDVGLSVASNYCALDESHTYFRYSKTMGIMYFRVAVKDTRQHSYLTATATQQYYKPMFVGSQGVDVLFREEAYPFSDYRPVEIYTQAKLNLSESGVFAYTVPASLITTEQITAQPDRYNSVSGWYLCNGRGGE